MMPSRHTPSTVPDSTTSVDTTSAPSASKLREEFLQHLRSQPTPQITLDKYKGITGGLIDGSTKHFSNLSTKSYKVVFVLIPALILGEYDDSVNTTASLNKKDFDEIYNQVSNEYIRFIREEEEEQIVCIFHSWVRNINYNIFPCNQLISSSLASHSR